MQKNKKTNKKSLDQLRMILDDISLDDIHQEDKEYIMSLSKRLQEPKQIKKTTYKNVAINKQTQTGEKNPLQPTVIIHRCEKKKKPEFLEVEQKPVKTIEKPFKREVMEFIEVKPKALDKKIEEIQIEKTKKPIETKTEKKSEKPEKIVEELPEWEPVKHEKPEIKQFQPIIPKEKKIEPIEEKPVEEFKPKSEYSYKIDAFKELKSVDEETAILLYDNGFVSIDDLRLASVKDIIYISGVKKKIAKNIKKEIQEQEELQGWKPAIGDLVEGEELSIKEEKTSDSIPVETKIEAFKELKSVDKETAVLLYDNYIKSVDDLKKIGYNDLVKIEELKKKTIKKIVEELEKIQEESLKVKPIDLGKSAKGELTKDQIEEDEKIVEEELPSPVELKRKSAEWTPTPEEDEEEPKWEHVGDEDVWDEKEIEELPGLDVKKEEKIQVFKDLKSVNDEIAVLLYDNGYTTMDKIIYASLKDLTNIKGLKKRDAKKIIKEIDEKGIFDPLVEKNIEDITEIKEKIITENKDIDEESLEIDDKILDYKPGMIKEEDFFEDEDGEELPITDDNVLDAFKGISSIDEKIARLLIQNGIKSVGDLIEKNIKDLTKIRGIRKKLAKEIKRDVKELVENSENIELAFGESDNPFVDENKESDDEWEAFEEGYKHKDYTLYEKEIDAKDGKKRIVRFFSKEKPDEGAPIGLPEGYKVEMNKKTDIPFLKKKKTKK